MIDLRTSRLLAGLVAGAGCLALALQPAAEAASPRVPSVQEPQEEPQDEEESAQEEHGPLHESMETLQDGMRALRKSMRDPEQKEAAVALCRELQAATLVGFQNPPQPLEPLEGDALVEHSAGFRKRMLEVCTALVDMELAIQKEDADAAKDLYRALGAFKKDGHDLYIE